MRIIIFYLLVSAGFGNVATADDRRILPLPSPAGASPELRRAVEKAWMLGLEPLPAPPSTAEWLETIADIDEQWSSDVLTLLKNEKVEMESDQVGGVPVFRILPESEALTRSDRVFVYLHGGAYVLGSGIGGCYEAILIASRLKMSVVSVDYRTAPRHPFPAALNDVVSVYNALLKTHNPASIVIGGTSAGGGLALAAVHKFKSASLPMPGAIFAGTPWTDLTKTGDTHFSNAGLDRFLVRYEGFLEGAAVLYAAGRPLTDPLISPVYGDFSKFPPTILISGTRDLFLSDVVRTHRKLRAATIPASLHVFEGMSHGGYVETVSAPESEEVYLELGRFLDEHLHSR